MTAEQVLGLGLQGSIMLTVLGFGLGATFRDANYLFRHPALLLRCVLSMSVVMPHHRRRSSRRRSSCRSR